MTASVAVRLLALAAAALLAGARRPGGARGRRATRTPPRRRRAPSRPVAGTTPSRSREGPAGDAERTTCGLTLTSRSLGVTHPVLPCHTKILVRYGDQTLFTEVIDTKLKSPRTQFELTESLARRLGLDGIQRVEWRFATGPSG